MGVWSDMPSWQVIGILGEEGDASAMRPARKDGDRVPRWARTGTDYAACLDRRGPRLSTGRRLEWRGVARLSRDVVAGGVKQALS
jgi:hypothetical protein